MSGAFSVVQFIPESLTVPDEMIYGYMIHQLAKTYGLTKPAAAKHTEFDFWEMLAYDNLDNKKEEYLIEQNRDK